MRITAESSTRLLGLAGEALVQRIGFPLVDSLWRLKGKQTGLLETLQLWRTASQTREEHAGRC